MARLEDNLDAAQLTLSPEDLHDVDDAAAMLTVQGARYPEALERLTGR